MHATRFALILICAAITGCGSGGPFNYVKVSGKVSYDDGSPIPNISALRLRFAPLDPPKVEGATPRPAYARLDETGAFDCATSYKYGDGLIPGKHKVAIETSNGPDNKLPVPKEYQSISTTLIEIDTANSPLEIKVPKPKAK